MPDGERRKPIDIVYLFVLAFSGIVTPRHLIYFSLILKGRYIFS
jgi:hypothetical protein